MTATAFCFMPLVHPPTSIVLATTPAAALACGLFFTPPISNAIDWITRMVTSLVPANIGDLGFVSPAQGQPAALTPSQSDALNAYNRAVNDFKSILQERSAPLNSQHKLPKLNGMEFYLALN